MKFKGLTTRIGILLIILLGLSACQPRGSHLYRSQTQPPIEHVVVVIDYLRMIDDVGKYWQFDPEHHQQTLDDLWLAVQSHMNQLGFPEVSMYLLGSGLSIQAAVPAEDQDPQYAGTDAAILYPPYLSARWELPPDQIQTHQDILHMATKYITWRRHHVERPDSMRGMHLGYHMDNLNLPANTAILYLHIDHSAVSFGKQLGSALLLGAIASQSDYAHVHMNGSSNKQASAFLLHHPSGDILWKNHSKQWRPNSGVRELLLNMPNQLNSQ